MQETSLLKGRVERLSKLQDAALNAGGAKARALLYMEALRSKVKQNSTMSIRGEQDLTGFPEGPGAEQADMASEPLSATLP